MDHDRRCALLNAADIISRNEAARMSLLRIDHVQITAPRAREREARHFYVNVLGLRELERPRTIPASGLLFALGAATELHVVLVENPFRPPLGDHLPVVGDALESIKR